MRAASLHPERVGKQAAGTLKRAGKHF